MGNIIVEKTQIIKCINETKITNDLIETLIYSLIPKRNNQPLTDLIFVKDKLKAAYNLNKNHILVNKNKLLNYLDEIGYILSEEYNIKYGIKEKIYLLLYALSHEVAHVIQYQTSKNQFDTYENVSLLYKIIFDNLDKLQDEFGTDDNILERNADMEGYVVLKKILTEQSKKEYLKILDDLIYRIYLADYYKFNGPMEEALKVLSVYEKKKELLKNSQMSLEDRLLYGLPIKKKEKSRILKK